MKKYFLAIALLFFWQLTIAQNKSVKKVANAVEQLRLAMINADSTLLDKLTDEKLSYGHSGGVVEDKAAFIKKIVSGKSDFVTIELVEQTISLSKKTAIVRHLFNATTNDNGKPGEVHLRVLLVWQKNKGAWKLLARQAVKIQ